MARLPSRVFARMMPGRVNPLVAAKVRGEAPTIRALAGANVRPVKRVAVPVPIERRAMPVPLIVGRDPMPGPRVPMPGPPKRLMPGPPMRGR